MGPRRPREAPRGPEEASRKFQDAPRGAQGSQAGSKESPRQPQDGRKDDPKSSPSSGFLLFDFQNPQETSREPPRNPQAPPTRPPQEAPGHPQDGPKRPQEGARATKRLPGFSSGVLGFSPERSWALALRSRASLLISALAFRVLIFKALNSVVLGIIREILDVSSEVLCFSSDNPTLD